MKHNKEFSQKMRLMCHVDREAIVYTLKPPGPFLCESFSQVVIRSISEGQVKGYMIDPNETNYQIILLKNLLFLICIPTIVPSPSPCVAFPLPPPPHPTLSKHKNSHGKSRKSGTSS